MESTMSISYTGPSIFPRAIALIFLSLLAIILEIPALTWHGKSRNLGATCLISWLLLLNLFNIINAIIWPNDDTAHEWLGYGLCDTEAKLSIGADIALPGCLAAIMRSLCQVMDRKKISLVPTAAQKNWNLVVGFMLCLGFPILAMALHYLVQNNRYYLFTISGCTPGLDSSWLAIVLIEIWPVILSLVDAYYATLLIIRLHRYKSDFGRLVAISKTTKSRFLRLFLMSALLVLLVLPVQLYVFYRNVQFGATAYSFAATHSGGWGEVFIIPLGGAVLFDRWIRVASGLIVFLFFGTGDDAVRMYKLWARSLGMGWVVWKLGGDTQGSGGSGRGWAFGLGSWDSVNVRARRLLGKTDADKTGLSGSGVTDTFPRSSISTDAQAYGPLSPGSFLSHDHVSKGGGILESKHIYQEEKVVQRG